MNKLIMEVRNHVQVDKPTLDFEQEGFGNVEKISRKEIIFTIAQN